MYYGINDSSSDAFTSLLHGLWVTIPLNQLQVGDVLDGAVVGAIDDEGFPYDVDYNNGFEGGPYTGPDGLVVDILRRDFLRPGHHNEVREYMTRRDAPDWFNPRTAKPVVPEQFPVKFKLRTASTGRPFKEQPFPGCEKQPDGDWHTTAENLAANFVELCDQYEVSVRRGFNRGDLGIVHLSGHAER